MGLGILEDSKGRDVPGTSTLNDLEPANALHVNTSNSHLKYDETGKYVLVPQPSDDPNDPLNWPLRQRDLILAALCMLAIIATTLSSILAPDSLAIAFHFEVDFTSVALLTGYHLLGVGIGGIFFVPSSRVYGKRHVYLIGTLLICVSSAWAGASRSNYHSFLAARIFQGIGLAPFEALIGASVGDLYYVHERGKRMALSTLSVFGSAFFTPVIVGKMSETIGWQWSFYFVAIFSGALFPLCFFFCPETAFVRSSALNTDIRTQANASTSLSGTNEQLSNDNLVPDLELTSHVPPPKVSYAKTLLPFNGRKTNEPFLELFFRPFPLFLNPGIIWACLIQGTLIGWTVLIGIVLAAIMLGPPLFFWSKEVGYLYSSALIGALIGFIFCGLVSDSSAKWLTKRNGGIYEPEFRILLVIPQLVFGGIGLYGFGLTASNTATYGYWAPEVFFGFVTAGMVCGAVASALYIVDAHRDIAIEAFTCLIIFKNVFSFALTFRGYDWLKAQGVLRIFNIVASVQVGICCTSILMYVFGKRNRSFWATHDLFGPIRYMTSFFVDGPRKVSRHD